MEPKLNNVVSLTQVRALREALAVLHTPEMKVIIYDGAQGEFKRLIAPVIRELLQVKGTPEHVQNELITLLETVYAAHHVDASQTADLARRVGRQITE